MGVNNDLDAEANQTATFTLEPLSSGTQIGALGTATLTVIDDDSFPANEVRFDGAASYSVNEDAQKIDLTVTRAALPGGNLSQDAFVKYRTHHISTQDARDYSLSIGTLHFEQRRINVSAAFFLSIEFQETGYLVYRMYQVAYGRWSNTPVPAMHMQDFVNDSQEIGRGVTVGVPGWAELLEARKQAFISEFVRRGRFKTALPPELTPVQFVDKLNTNIGSLLTPAVRDQLVAQIEANNTEASRASVLRTIAEQQSLRDSEFRRAFVLMQYLGYLRRDPISGPDFNYDGYNFWLNKLDQFNGNFIGAEMVKAFITSSEYRSRFGPP